MDVQSAANLNIPEGSVRNIHDKDKRLLWSAVGYNTRYDGDTTQQTYTGKNLFSFNRGTNVIYPTSGVEIEKDDSSVTLTSNTTTGAQFYGVILLNFDSTKTYTISCKGKKIVKGTDGRPQIKVAIYGSNDDGETWVSLGGPAENNPTEGQEYTLEETIAGYEMYRFYFYNNTYTPVTLGEKTTYYDIQIESGSAATSFEPYVGGIPSPNPDYPQDVNVVKGRQDVLVSAKNLLSVSFAVPGGVPSDIPTNTFVLDRENQRYFRCDFPTLLPPGTYTISFDISNNNTLSGVSFNIFNKSQATIGGAYNLSGIHYSGTFTVTESIQIIRWFIASNESNDKHATISNVQVEAGSTATAYEMYQGQQTIPVDLGSTELCKIGNYQDYIFKSSGKNLFDGILESGLINGNTGEDMPNASYIRSKDFIPVSENTTYTLSAKDYPDAYYFWYEYKSDYTYNLTQNKTSKEGTFTTNPGTAFVRFRFTTDFTDTSTPTQLEKGFSATPYEPYGTDWYVYKETKSGTVSLGNTVYTLNGGLKGSVYAPLDRVTANGNAFCDRASVGHGSYDIWPGCFYENPANVMFVGNTTDDSASLKAKYNGAIFYYALSTPIYTKITDNTLISQLNALRDWLIRYDYYGAVTGNLPIIINRTGLT